MMNGMTWIAWMRGGRVSGLATALLLGGLVGCEPVRHNLDAGYAKQRGYEAMERGQYAKAQPDLAYAANLDPADGRLQHALGVVYLKADRALDAQLALERAYELKPNDSDTPGILDALAEALYRQNANQRLFDMLQAAVDQRGTTRDYIRQGDYLSKIGDADNAALAYKKAASTGAPKDPRPYVAMADFYESIGDRPQAITNLRKAHGLVPDDVKIADRLRELGIVPGPAARLPIE